MKKYWDLETYRKSLKKENFHPTALNKIEVN